MNESKKTVRLGGNCLQQYNEWKKIIQKKWWASALKMLTDFILAAVAVLPLLYGICKVVPFSYEVNDDATIVQILDGSYTGEPDAHAIFIKYPLSLLMSELYNRKPAVRWLGNQLDNVNWYIGVIVLLTAFALVMVLFQLLNYFRCNHFLFCSVFVLGFAFCWLPCFSAMTFSTAAGFFGCMALLFFGFLTKENACRPWNLCVLGILMMTAWCLRKQCLYMVVPFLLIELVVKYHIHFFKSIRPWIIFSFCGILLAGLIVLDARMYSAQEWKHYFIYNHARAWLQDYEGFPEYEDEKEFYDSLGIDETKRNAMARYTYCMTDDFDTDWVEKTYIHSKEKQPEIPIAEKWKQSQDKAKEYLFESEQTNKYLKMFSFYFWVLLLPLFVLTAIMRWKAGIGCLFRNVFRIVSMAVVLWMEWSYLAMNGRFPQRVEEVIRLLTLTVGVVLTVHILHMWRDAPLVKIHVFLQIAVLYFFLQPGILRTQIENIKGIQKYNLSYAAEKSEVLEYCQAHPEAYFVLDTQSFTKMSRPQDNLSQGNWFMSGSWAAYTPLYRKKLEQAGTVNLGSSFLLRDNVYLITKGKKNIAALLGYEDKERVEAEIADEIATTGNYFFVIYKIKKVVK